MSASGPTGLKTRDARKNDTKSLALRSLSLRILWELATLESALHGLLKARSAGSERSSQIQQQD